MDDNEQDKRATQEMAALTLPENPYKDQLTNENLMLITDVAHDLKRLAAFAQALDALPGDIASPHMLQTLETVADLGMSLFERLIEVIDELRAGKTDDAGDTDNLPF